VLLRDQLLQRLAAETAPSIARVQTTAEMLLERRRLSFDANHPEPTSGPVAEALRKGRERQTSNDAARQTVADHGRFYSERYLLAEYENRHGTVTALYRWRVMDRLTGQTARFMLAGDSKPKWQTRLQSKDEAMRRVAWLNGYMARLSAPAAPVALPDAEPAKPEPAPWTHLGAEMPDSAWAAIDPLAPLPVRKGTVLNRIVIAAIVYCLRTGFPVSGEIPRAAGCSGDTARK
jgi:hypothetical protein